MRKLLVALAAVWAAAVFAAAPAAAQFAGGAPLAVLSGKTDPCPGATLCGSFTTSQFKGFGSITSSFAALPNLTVTRASVGYAENPDGSLVLFQPGQARVTPKGLGVFEATTNLVLQSQAFNLAAWSQTSLVVSPNVIAAPDGTVTGSKITETAVNSQHNVFTTGGLSLGAISYTVSGYMKAAERTFGRLDVATAGNDKGVTFDLNSCQPTFSDTGYVGVGYMTAGGWCRVYMTFTGTAATYFAAYEVMQSGTGSAAYLGVVNSGIYVWGLDLRAGAYPVPYCPTAASTATCAADIVSFNLTLPPEGIFAASYLMPSLPNSSTTREYLMYVADSGNSRFSVRGNDAAAGVITEPVYIVGDGAALTQLNSAIGYQAGGVVRVAAAYSSLSAKMAYALNGTPPQTAARQLTSSLVGAQTLYLGNVNTGSNPLNSYITGFALYPQYDQGGTLQALSNGGDTSSLSLNFASGLYKTTTPYVRTNLLSNSVFIGTPGLGQPPTGWVSTGSQGNTISLSAAELVNGVSTMVVKHRRITTGSGIEGMQPVTLSFNATGTPYLCSAWYRIPTGVTAEAAGMYFGTGSPGNVLLASAAALNAQPKDTWVRYSATVTFTVAPNGTAFANTSPGNAGDGWDIALPQCEPTSATVPSSNILTTGSAVSVATTQSTNPADVGALSYTGPAGYAQWSNGTLQFFPANTPRVTDQGALIEEARTNIALQSQSIGTTPWNMPNGSFTVAAATAPDGMLTASKVTPNTSNLTHNFYQSITYTAAANSLAVYAKAAGYSYLKLGSMSTGSGQMFNVSTCATVGSPSAGYSATVTSVASGWCRIAVTWTPSAGADNAGAYVSPDGTNVVFSGDGTSGVYVWQMDSQLGSFITSPILTTSATVTRAADVMVYGLSLSPTALTLAGTGSSVSQPVVARLASLTDGVNNLDIDANGGTAGYVTGNTLTGGGASVGPTLTAGLPITVAASLSAGAVHGSGNGQAATTLGGTQTMGTITTLRVGDLYTGGRPLNGYERELHLYPYAANDNELPYRSAGNF